MTAASARDLRRLLATRDAFLAVVADKLAARVAALAAAPEALRVEHVAGLQSFAAELGLIAAPDRPIRPDRRPIDLAELLGELAEPARAAAAGVVAEVTAGGTVIGRWDRSHLETLVAELGSNAMKYARGGDVVLRLEVARARVRIVVENPGDWRGPRTKVERFRRDERRRGVRGYGVGLWLCGRLARANGGRLSFTARNGKTLAVVTLPLDEVRGDPAAFRLVLRLRATTDALG